MAAPETLTLSQVSYAFVPGKPALADVSAGFSPGRLTVILGPNGSGKTTLLRLMAGLIPAQSGTVFLSGKDVLKLSSRQRARHIAMVPQRTEALLDMTVMDLVLLGRTPHLPPFSLEGPVERRLAQEAMAQTGIASLYDRPAATLSGGELQRAAIARALCQHTPVLLLDEPVSSLDIGHQVAVMQLLSRLVKEQQMTVACVLHDLNLAAHFADEALLLSEGRLIAAGPIEEVLTEDKLFKAYGIPVRRIEDGKNFALMPEMDCWEKLESDMVVRQMKLSR